MLPPKLVRRLVLAPLVLVITIALLFAASTYALRLYINLRRVRSGGVPPDANPTAGHRHA